MSPIGQRMSDIRDIPLGVFFLLEQLDPHVRNSHGKTIVETEAAFVDGSTESRHAGHVFSDGDDGRVEVVEELVGEHEVGDCFEVDVVAKVLVVAACESGTSMTCKEGD